MAPKQKANTRKTEIFLSPEDYDAVKQYAKEKGQSVSGFIRMIILEYLANKK